MGRLVEPIRKFPDPPVKGRLESVQITPGRSDGLFIVYLLGNSNPYLVIGNEAVFQADGKPVTYSELMAWIVKDAKSIEATLHPVAERYMAVLQAEFVRA